MKTSRTSQAVIQDFWNFEHSHWVIIWKRELYSLKEFQDLCDHRKTQGKGTNLLTFTCVMEIIETPTMRELHETIDSSLPVAQELVLSKRQQSERALKGMRQRVVARPAELMLLRHVRLQRPHPAKGLPQVLNPRERAHQALASMRLVRSTFAKCRQQSFLRARLLHCCIHLLRRRRQFPRQHQPQHPNRCL